MSTDFELFCKAWEEDGTKLVILERGEHYFLYMTYKEYEYKHNFYRTSPVFQCFNNHTGKREFVVTSSENPVKAEAEARNSWKIREEEYCGG